MFIAVIDGARYSETYGDVNHQYIPNIWNKLKPQGTIYTSFYNNGGTYTVPGHSSIITGTWQDLPNDGSERPNQPTLFEYYRKQYNSAQSKNYVILGKDKLDVLAYSTNPDYGNDFKASVKYFQSLHPALLIPSRSLSEPYLTTISTSRHTLVYVGWRCLLKS